MATDTLSLRAGRALALVLLLGGLLSPGRGADAAPAGAADLEGLFLTAAGTEKLKVKGLGRAKDAATLNCTFGASGLVLRGVGESALSASYEQVGGSGRRAVVRLDGDSLSALAALLADRVARSFPGSGAGGVDLTILDHALTIRLDRKLSRARVKVKVTFEAAAAGTEGTRRGTFKLKARGPAFGPAGDGRQPVPLPIPGSLQNPAWSPDGRELLFTRFAKGYNREPADLLVVEVETGAVRTLVSDGSGNVNLPGAVWNGVTGRVAFSSSREPHDEIYVIDGDGSPGDEVRITSRTHDVAYEPSLSPDGRWVVFESHRVDVAENGVIVKRRTDGTGEYVPLTAPEDDCRQPNWSPRGDLVLYQRFAAGRIDLWLVSPDGTGRRQITSGPGDKTDASFSPDGDWIVYSSDEGGLEHANLFVRPVAGGPAVRVTDHSGYDGAPSWSPDGEWIAFESCRGDPDGSPGTILWRVELADLLSVAPEGELHVATSGDDESPGTEAEPFRTIQHALDRAGPGSTVHVKAGTYAERLTFPRSGTAADGHITLRSFGTDRVVISGEGAASGSGENMLYLEDVSYVRIVGLEIVGGGTVEDASGIRVFGSGHHVEIRDNVIREIRGRDAMGITVYGRDGPGIHDLVIDGNEIRDCDPAHSEALVVNGNVRDFEITDNVVKDVNNIGIDVIGGEAWLSSAFPARGLIRGNTVIRANSTYDGSAAGIYIDGASDCVIEGNTVTACDFGIEVGAENKGVTTASVIVRGNFLYGNYRGGIIFGGYGAKRGRVEDCLFLNNTLYGNNRPGEMSPQGYPGEANGEIILQWADRCTLESNIVFGIDDIPALVERWGTSGGMIWSHNIFFRRGADPADFPDGPGTKYSDPLLVSPDAGDLHLRAGSPAIDAGRTPPRDEAGTKDIDGETRVKGDVIDIGADER